MHIIKCGVLVVFAAQATSNNNKNMSQSPIVKGLHRITPQRHIIDIVPSRTGVHSSVLRQSYHRIFKPMYTTETSAGSDNIVGHWLLLPHTNGYIVPRLSFEGGIFKEQATHSICIARRLA